MPASHCLLVIAGFPGLHRSGELLILVPGVQASRSLPKAAKMRKGKAMMESPKNQSEHRSVTEL